MWQRAVFSGCSCTTARDYRDVVSNVLIVVRRVWSAYNH